MGPTGSVAVDARTVVLVEGVSDQRAVEALARRHGRDLEAERVSVVAIGGATNARRFVESLGTRRSAVALAGLCDAGEEGAFRRGLVAAGVASRIGSGDMERLGFFVCVADLEDELIRSLGADTVLGILDAGGELRSFRTFQKQPAQQQRPVGAQLRRFIGTRSGRKIRYGTLLVDALDLTRVPRPLDGLLARI